MDVFYLSQTIGGVLHFFISKHTIAVFQNDVTKCLAVRNFHRISTAGFFQKFLRISDIGLEMSSDSKY